MLSVSGLDAVMVKIKDFVGPQVPSLARSGIVWNNGLGLEILDDEGENRFL
jgi:hypothetical protein